MKFAALAAQSSVTWEMVKEKPLASRKLRRLGEKDCRRHMFYCCQVRCAGSADVPFFSGCLTYQILEFVMASSAYQNGQVGK